MVCRQIRNHRIKLIGSPQLPWLCRPDGFGRFYFGLRQSLALVAIVTSPEKAFPFSGKRTLATCYSRRHSSSLSTWQRGDASHTDQEYPIRARLP